MPVKTKLNFRLVAIIAVAIFAVAGAVIITLDWREMRLVLSQANWIQMAPAFMFTALSYLCLDLAFAMVFRTFGSNLNYGTLLRIGFVSNVISYLMNVGGATGVSVQFVLLKKKGLATQDILAASLFQLYFSSLMLIALLPAGLFSILADRSVSTQSSRAIAVAGGILTILMVAAGFIVFAPRTRAAVLRGLNDAARFITRHDFGKQLDDFHMALSRGVTILRQKPFVFVTLLALTIGDWVGLLAALAYCFSALGSTPGLGTLLTGFSLGITAGFISFVPGGLGVQEGSMAGLYALLGVPLQTAVLAAILFRIVYYFVPFVASLGFYRRLLQDADNVS